MRRLVYPLLATACVAAFGGAAEGRFKVGPSAHDGNGIRLTSEVPSRVRAACRQARKLVVIEIICPELVPRGRVTPNRNLYGPIVYYPERAVYLLSFNNGEIGDQYPHWIVGRGARAPFSRLILSDEANVVKGRPSLVRTLRIGAYRADIYRYPAHPRGGPNGGHLAAAILCRGMYYFASIHHLYSLRSATAVSQIAAQLATTAGCRVR